MPVTIKCQDCGATFLEAVGPCTKCGGTIEMSITLTGVQTKCLVGNVGVVADSPTPHGGQQIRYRSPTGSQAEASLVGNQFTVQVKPPVEVGTNFEQRVLSCVVDYLQKSGKIPTSMSGNDAKGEDGVLQIDGDRVIVQIVTATPGTEFFGSVAKGNGEVQGELNQALDWIHTAISKKGKRYAEEVKSSMLLCVDVVNMGVLASPVVGTQYLERYGDPSAHFGFGAVWLVGPTENNILKLGTSRW
jgi:hypothetical protein